MRQVGRRNHNETNMRNPIAIVMAALASAGHTGSAAFGNPVDNPNPLGYRSRGKGRGEAGGTVTLKRFRVRLVLKGHVEGFIFEATNYGDAQRRLEAHYRPRRNTVVDCSVVESQ